MKQITIYFFCFFCFGSNAQTWNWSTALKIQNNSLTLSNEFADSFTDGNNLYVVGFYGGSFFGTTDTINSSGTSDLFIAKYNSSGSEQWIKGFGGYYSGFSDYELAFAFHHPLNNDIYLSGNYINGMWLDTAFLPSHSGDSTDIFIARMDVNGNYIWAKHFGSLGTDFGRLFCKPNGNILLIGGVRIQTFIESFQIDPGVFIAEFDQDGNCLWAETKMYLGTSNTYNLLVDFIGSDMIVAGHFTAANGYIDTASISTNGYDDGFICRLDSTGNIKWVKTFGGSNFGYESITSMAVTSNHDILLGLRYANNILFEGTPLNANGASFALTKISGNGQLIWLQDMENSGTFGAIATIKIVNDGSIYLTGGYSGSARFGNDTLFSSFSKGMYLARYEDTGDFIGVIDFGEGGGYGVEQDLNGNIYSMGYFSNTVSFGSNTFTSLGPRDLYLAKLSGAVGVGENQRVGAGELLIYGNPNAGTFTIELPTDLKPNKPFQLSIINSSGKVSYFNEVSAEGDIDLDTDLPNGLYTVTVLQGSKFYSGKMVIAD